MRAVTLDTSVYIEVLRRPAGAGAALRRLTAGAAVWLTAVVLEELYAGARGAQRRAVERLEADFDQAGRLLVPTLDDWRQAGLLLACLAERYGYEQIGRGRLTNDALIAMVSARNGLTLLTTNRRDFARLSEFCPLRWELVDLTAPHSTP
jgi:predicted nucleic acid-binding protein